MVVGVVDVVILHSVLLFADVNRQGVVGGVAAEASIRIATLRMTILVAEWVGEADVAASAGEVPRGACLV